MCHYPGHFLGNCDVVAHYLALGKIARNGINLVIANGDWIPNEPRMASWAQLIDEYYTGHPAAIQPVEHKTPPHMSANFLEIEEESEDATNIDVYLEALTEMVDEAEDPEAIERVIRVLQLRTKEAQKVKLKKDARLPEVPTIEVTEALDEEDSHTEDNKPLPKVLASKRTPYVDILPNWLPLSPLALTALRPHSLPHRSSSTACPSKLVSLPAMWYRRYSVSRSPSQLPKP
jgi:hypothetical protein